VGAETSFSFSDPSAGLHCFGRGGEPCVVLAAGNSQLSDPVELTQVDGSFQALIPSVAVVELVPLGAPVDFAAEGAREWLCRLRGSGPGGVELSGFGAIRSTPAPERRSLRRSLWICFDAELAFAIDSSLNARRGGHGDEQVTAFVARGAPLEAARAEDPRLSSTYREDGQLLRAGIELWEHDDETPEGSDHDRHRALRLAGETIAAASLQERASAAFMAWHCDGMAGIGCYIIERAP
jgi:hypothetical protein